MFHRFYQKPDNDQGVLPFCKLQYLADTHNLTYVGAPVDALADHITALADDVVFNDDTKNLLVALKRAQVISGPQMNSLLVQYLTGV